MILSDDYHHNRKQITSTIYLAGGCFWGIEKLMQSIPGVIDATSGYANGPSEDYADYRSVYTGKTGFRETVRVEYDPNKISLDAILFAFFRIIDPTVMNAQGNDKGTQYQTGIYYTDEGSKDTVERISNIERNRHTIFNVEIGPLKSFYNAEEYHQNYLDKNPQGYCHISKEKMNEIAKMIVNPADYRRPSEIDIKQTLTPEQYSITQEGNTESPFVNEYHVKKEKGIYVDVVTGEPLFSSKDKFDTSCGWPGFTSAIDNNSIVLLKDESHGMRRVEARSRAGNSHLGHVFYNDPESPNGTRFCINSASLRFVPYDSMEKEGYGHLKSIL
jgi:peptide methionine sulfoxide reductase msrA/msrB